MQRQLNENNTLIFTEHFPYNSKDKQVKKYKALLGIGGNIGNVVRRFEQLFLFLKKSRVVNIVDTAPILKNPPFGYLEQGDFYNSLLWIETNLTPRDLLMYVLRVEKHFGRKRLFKDGPRTLDIDIIFYDNIKMQTKTLTLPHPEWMNRESVLIPMPFMSKNMSRRKKRK
jgi:2-amino-4-hydroxy-6-hydroxymethyldihydropteridine diphosphokinase